MYLLVANLRAIIFQGGFSYVYLVQDISNSELFALKKIRCPFGAESVSLAMNEVEAYRAFAGAPGIIHSIDYSIATERGGGEDSKTVYVLLPYYKRGNLQDMINANLVNGTQFPERKLMVLFLGVCRALKTMHQYKGENSSGKARPIERMRMGNEADDDLDSLGSDSSSDSDLDTGKQAMRKFTAKKNKNKKPVNNKRSHHESSFKNATADTGADGDHESAQQKPLMGTSSSAELPATSFAHRDIKPGNIMIDDSGTGPILMDLGSVAPSPLFVTSHSQAVAVQDTAAEHSTMPYRAPELFDVHNGAVIDTKVDIWSLGCTLYACLVGKSPFEARSDETGGSLSLCVLGGDWRFPGEGGLNQGAQRQGTAANLKKAQQDAAAGSKEVVISEPVKDIVRKCLAVEPVERPDIDELIRLVEDAIDVDELS
ncbi:Serine/threonine-protein kinase env7 [Ceratocystis pirilliformis]|uniref:non-specific serine/threonine protein kinase n=1 Tax=Ceratocystis pirilliformis TaxID=259994 RepID=A0ABR3ZG22_9PEZI